jgi:hypothetical protein
MEMSRDEKEAFILKVLAITGPCPPPSGPMAIDVGVTAG